MKQFESCIFDYTTREIFTGKGEVKSITLAADGAAAGLTVYDGLNTSAAIKTRLKVISGDTKTFMFGYPLYFNKGMYVVADNANSKYTIVFRQLDEKED